MVNASSQQAESPKVKSYFEREAEAFDSIYSGKKSGLMRLLDKVLRRDMYQRMEITLRACGDPALRTVLDIGTGTGRFLLPLAKDKDRLLGIDFSAPMIEMARRYAEEQGVADRCAFEVADFLTYDFKETFDAIMAIGLFDYLSDPLVFLKRMRSLLGKKLVATYPALWTWRAPVRKVRLGLLGCPVYYYTPKRIRDLHEQAGLAIDRLDRVGKIYVVTARPE